jgi:sugar phosphate permease
MEHLSSFHESGNAVKKTLRKRWIIWGSMISVYVVGFFHRVAPAVIADDLMRSFQTSGVLLGGLSSVYFYTYALMQIPAGILSDTLGPRLTITIGALIMGFGTIVFGTAPSLIACYTGRFLIGLGVSVILVNILRTCVEWYRPNEMGFVTGLTTTVGGIGGLLATTPLAMLSNALSWRISFVMIGFFSIFLALHCWWVVRNRPTDCGLSPLQNNKEKGNSDTDSKIGIWLGLKTIAKNPYTWPPFFGFFSFYSTLMAFSGLWGIPYLTQIYGLPSQKAANYTMVVLFGLILGCPFLGYLSDKILSRRKTPYIFCALVYSVVWGVLYFKNHGQPPLGFMYPICFLMGFSSSGFILTIVCSKEVNPLDVAGIAMGVVNTSGFLGSAILQVLLGKILDMKWDKVLINGVRIYSLDAYRIAFCICFVTTLMGLGAAFLIKETKCRNIFHPV